MGTMTRAAVSATALAMWASAALAGSVCSPGTFDDGGMCVPCDPGTFQSISGASTCLDCPVGRFSATPGQSSCQNCAPGTFSGTPGQSTCDDCAPGTAQPLGGSASCNFCDPGTFSATPGQSSCADCETGTFSAMPGQSSCDDCTPGTFASGTGQSSCDLCFAGFFSSEFGQTSCVPCSPGSFSDLDGAASCELCEVGTYQSVPGATSCVACDAGTYQDMLGQALCEECPGGAATPCSGNGVCAEGAGDGTCTCDEGFSGADCASAGTDIPVTAKKLIIIDKTATVNKAKVVYVSKDTLAGITKGAGTDPADIEASFTFGYDASVGQFTMPQGANWLVNKTTVAKYVNKEAPAGPGGAKVSVVKPGKLIKVVGASLGDLPIDLFAAGIPDGDVATAYTLTNGGETFRFCSAFAPASAVYKEIAGGMGRKLVAKNGVGAPCESFGSPSGAFVD